MIAPDIAALAVPVGGLTPHPRNVREGDVGAISESLRRFGQLKPIVVQKSTGYVVAGNHLYRAAVALGWKEVAAVRADLDDETAIAYLVADNRTQELGTYDDAGLAALLSELAAAGNLDATGYDGDDVDRLLADLARTEIDPEAPPAGADDEGTAVDAQYAVAVLCSSEAHQREVFERLAGDGYAVKVLTV